MPPIINQFFILQREEGRKQQGCCRGIKLEK